ncbi:hypothetical protein B0H14DRAFT_2637823 [Mycena olivaceomarginata]|nr:hypothetical protein B0H14DRAFT_2637823 [Mycena olivaceomarginata]
MGRWLPGELKASYKRCSVCCGQLHRNSSEGIGQVLHGGTHSHRAFNAVVAKSPVGAVTAFLLTLVSVKLSVQVGAKPAPVESGFLRSAPTNIIIVLTKCNCSSSAISEPSDSAGQSALYEMRRFSTTTSHPMPAVRWSRRLQDIVRTSLVNSVAVAILPDPYPSDGARVNYLITRDPVTDIVEGLLDYQGLLARREIKPGESQDFIFDQCLPGYRLCQQMYRHEWKAVYTTSERKLTEWVDHLSVGGEQGMEKEFLRWLGLRGLTSIVKYI